MAAIALEYNQQSISVQRTLNDIFSVALFNIKTIFQRKSRLERSLREVERGNVFFLAGPKKL